MYMNVKPCQWVWVSSWVSESERKYPKHKLGCFLFEAEDGIRVLTVTGVQTCALPISSGTRGGRGVCCARRPSRDPPARRGRAVVRLCNRGRLPGAGRRPPRRREAHGPRRRRGWLVGRAPKWRRSWRVGPGACPIRGGLIVVLTRPAERSAKLAARLEALGFDVVVSPLIELEPIANGPIDLPPYDRLGLTRLH